MTFLPAADGDVVDNNGAQFYDQATPGPRKVQLYIDHANHNFFNRQWLNDDARGILPLMARTDHERVLLTYGCAFFRNILRGDATSGYLEGKIIPVGLQNQNVHLAFAIAESRIIDNYDGHSITQDSEGQPTTQSGGLTAQDFRFAQAGGAAFNSSFFGNTEGNVANAKEATGDFREPLKGPADLTATEVHVSRRGGIPGPQHTTDRDRLSGRDLRIYGATSPGWTSTTSAACPGPLIGERLTRRQNHVVHLPLPRSLLCRIFEDAADSVDPCYSSWS
jgi:hypothetical protein